MIVSLEIWIESDAKKSVFLLSEDFDFSKGGALSGRGVNTVDLALKFDEVN